MSGNISEGAQRCRWCDYQFDARYVSRFMRQWGGRWECKATVACQRRTRDRFKSDNNEKAE